MTKKDLVDAVADMYDADKKEVKDIVDGIFDTIMEYVAAGEKVAITGFGTFSYGEREGREGRNPKTGEAMTISPSRTVKFKAGKTFKDVVKDEM